MRPEEDLIPADGLHRFSRSSSRKFAALCSGEVSHDYAGTFFVAVATRTASIRQDVDENGLVPRRICSCEARREQRQLRGLTHKGFLTVGLLRSVNNSERPITFSGS